MKNFISLLLSITPFFVQAQAENYGAFKLDLASGYSLPQNRTLAGDVKGGFNISLEPKFNLTDHLTVGIKAEGAIMAAVNNPNTINETSSLSVTTSYLLTGEYYFGNGLIRPYAGVAGGIYNTGVIDGDAEYLEELIQTGRKLGVAPRAGFQIGHFRVGAEYNIVPKNSYLSFKIGVTIGGGRKD